MFVVRRIVNYTDSLFCNSSIGLILVVDVEPHNNAPYSK